ncbi:P-loop containing nucleoside triphosphate hydrolase protein [Aspergillus avenaceus]|uniref:P-loop containing nucleoside triphosphate hydrolase protein n=1 Tax=Aspergillus avenaceus TaxID=36643 RepID=A0A5N6U389_ASPAV|nr:P-loop containing nucleoside triphosphate hydrolase protein [Aspergillus avenaceus]
MDSFSTAVSENRRPIVISGPSGAGKGTLVQKLFDQYPDTFTLTVSHTMREPRPNEVDGIHYFFIPPSAFDTLIAEDAFVEHSKGKVVVLDIEIINVCYVFIKPPSFEALESRFRKSGTEKDEDIQRRLAQAKAELEYAEVQGSYDKIIVNGDLDSAYRELEEFVCLSNGWETHTIMD